MGSTKILLADPSRFYLELEKGFLQGTNARLLTATDGHEALAVIRDEAPALIYMTLNLPGLDGAACCRQIKQDKLLQAIPLILLHENGRVADALCCRAAGCDAVLEKPLKRTEFLEIGKRFLPFLERRDLRYPCQQLVVLRYGDECCCGTSFDLSGGGMYVGANWALRERTPISLSFVLPGGSNRVVETTSQVAWINHGATRPKPALPQGFGVRFLEIRGQGRQLLDNFFDHNRSQSSL